MIKIISTKILIVILSLSIVGCKATRPLNKVPQQTIADIKSGKIATNFVMANKRINYTEVLFRGAYLDTKATALDYSGIWNPHSDVLGWINQSLPQLGLTPVSVSEVLSNQDIFKAYEAALIADYNENSETKSDFRYWPWNEYFLNYPSYDGFEEVRNQLLASDVEYLFEWLSPDVFGKAIGYGMVSVAMYSNVRIIDLKNRKVIWHEQLDTKQISQLGGDLKKLEENNLALLKENVQIGVKSALSVGKAGKIFWLN